MSNYNKATNFSVKDTLTSGDPDKVVSGAEIDSEFDAISSAVGSKADKVSSATTDNLASLDANGNLKDSGDSVSSVLTKAELPSGSITMFAATSAPSGWLECDGSNVSRSTYSDLFSAIGTSFGSGDGSSTFGLPDLRGEFVRGWDNGRGVDSGRSFGTTQSDELKSHNHSGSQALRGNGEDENNSVPSASDSTNPGRTWNFTVDNTGGDETRPRNIALMYIIKT